MRDIVAVIVALLIMGVGGLLVEELGAHLIVQRIPECSVAAAKHAALEIGLVTAGLMGVVWWLFA